MPNFHDGHRERLRKRFLKEGLDNFSPHEVLELLLYLSIPRVNTNPLAHSLVEKFGSFSNAMEAPYSELLKVKGIGDNSAFSLKLIQAVSRYYMLDKNSDGAVLDTTEKLGNYILPKFFGVNNERLYLLCLDKKRKLLNCELLVEGSPDSVSVDLRKVVETAMSCSATMVVLTHNHTQGFALPSSSDLRVTEQIIDVLEKLSIKVVDHIIVARDDFVSLADSGFMFNNKQRTD